MNFRRGQRYLRACNKDTAQRAVPCTQDYPNTITHLLLSQTEKVVGLTKISHNTGHCTGASLNKIQSEKGNRNKKTEWMLTS